MWIKQVIKTNSESVLSLHGFVELARPFWTKGEDSMWEQREKKHRAPVLSGLLIGNAGVGVQGTHRGTDPEHGQ